MKRYLGMVGAAVALFTSIAVNVHSQKMEHWWEEGLEPMEAERFIAPGVCAGCHAEIFEMWDGSMHSHALADTLFRAASKLLLTEVTTEGERLDAEHCISCHNPVAYRSGQITGTSDYYGNVDEVTMNSIFCDMCHSVDEVVRTRNASINTAPGHGEDDPGVKRGPRDDAEPMYHDAEYSKLHTSAEFCGACHNVTHLAYMTRLEGTYDEWFHSPYNDADPGKRVVCQDCHMRQAPGKPGTGMTERGDFPGRSAMMGPERPHIWRHYVAGANTIIPDLEGNELRHRLAVERLRNAAVLEIVNPRFDGGRLLRFTVRVRNEGAGHMLPTGVTEFRQMWLEITVADASGQTLYSVGGMDAEDELTGDTPLFNTVFGDPDGNPTLNVARAKKILTDRRVPPQGWSDEIVSLPAPLPTPLTVTAVLKYRSMIPSLARTLLDDTFYEVPVIEMTRETTVIE